jgi:AbrB family looped-hinge helix DNA binding protein
MKNLSRISSKGQVTVPQKIRARLGVVAGDQIEFVVEGERTVIRPARSASASFARFVGALPAFSGVKEINEWIHEMRDDEATAAKKRGRK